VRSEGDTTSKRGRIWPLFETEQLRDAHFVEELFEMAVVRGCCKVQQRFQFFALAGSVYRRAASGAIANPPAVFCRLAASRKWWASLADEDWAERAIATVDGIEVDHEK
jgi:hypothetical protein